MKGEHQTLEQTVTIDDIVYPVSSLSPKAQELVSAFNEWNADSNAANRTASQLKVAVEALTNQIIAQVRHDNQAKVDADAAAKKSMGQVPTEDVPDKNTATAENSE